MNVVNKVSIVQKQAKDVTSAHKKMKECLTRTGLFEHYGLKKKKKPLRHDKTVAAKQLKCAHLPTQRVMEYSAFGLSFMCSANK